MTRIRILEEIEILNFIDSKGSLNVAEFHNLGKFETKRMYFISNVPENVTRGAHAHRNVNQIFFAVSGKFTLTVTDGTYTESVEINSRDKGYFLPSGYWRDLENFTQDAVCVVLASDHYDENDYIRSYEEYLEWIESE